MKRFQVAQACALTSALMALVAAAPAQAAALAGDPAATCSGLAGPGQGAFKIDSAALQSPTPLAVAEKGPTPSGRITPANPAFCKVLGHIDPSDASAPPIRFEVNLPTEWNGRSLQYGGGGFNGVLITGLALPPAQPFDKASPLAQGFVTYGTDSGHESKPGEPPQVFALNDEAFENFAHKAYKKVRDAAVDLMVRAYGKRPDRMYFMGSSEGGREAMTMAQRYPEDFDGILARVPVINWVGLLHASNRSGLVTMGEAWIRPAQVKLVADAVRKTCDKADGSDDQLIEDPVSCKASFRPETLRCTEGQSGDQCLSDQQIAAINTLHSPFKFPFALANGLDDYPGWGVSGEDTPAFGPTGGWSAWWLGTAAPALPPVPANAIQWVFGSGAIQYVMSRDPKLDVRAYKPEDHKERLLQVSNLMDSTNPDLGKFRAHGGRLIMLEYMADYAQSPYAGIRYFEKVQATLGKAETAEFARLYTAPGVDHVGSGAPANVDMLGVLVDWVENGKAPGDLEVVEQKVEAPAFPVVRALPLCQWPAWPHYKSGDVNAAASFACAP
ncbi:tannase/feruloyl esterase family alpha/beta hydrolase [Bradyrhizobium sp.]|uniref:tannase/feruloyl esterase family alpha/beta hydrolase n=2 Tax=Bradyrhizobium sp. TaxID=376 RepID=UPI001EBAD533|nr:tannase/feruloyl esterase family alpha/beta hydrolase [Bradyrhizobium sp.]MBV8916907.1 tannase/feruloyl esterase family alpha/beta hydrolase [Bradyrhizobium sp.]MBV9981668.1 tannase/feruloyl esterase family alpha/beta hydrolase [Bradyrhizobium sp.]